MMVRGGRELYSFPTLIEKLMRLMNNACRLIYCIFRANLTDNLGV